jgi:hypothetical protein
MRSRLTPVRVVLAAAVVLVAACHDGGAPLAPDDPAFNAAANAARPAQDLALWFAQASPDVMALQNTVFADHDTEAGRLVFGVEHPGVAHAVRTVLAARGVPASAYEIRTVEPIYFASGNLRSRHRPTQGGLQIHWSNYVCTLGFNVDHAGGRSFITNSHCTANQGTTGNTLYYQPASSVDSSPIAQEAHDPAYSRGGQCSRGKVCRYSDAARALYDGNTASTRGAIARPTTGPNTGDLSVSGSFTIASQDNSTTSWAPGTVMNKVGRTTGWGQGNVTSSCATVNVSGTNIQLLCQTLVQKSGSVIVQGGDSGSPVFRITSGSDVQLVGILWGGNQSGDLFVFSPLKGIQDELGGVTATADGSGGGGGGGGGGDDGGGECVPRGNGNNCK